VISGTSTKVEADDDASTKGVVSPESPGGLKTATPSASDLNVNEIPTIKISSEEDREREDEEKKTVTNGDETKEKEAPETHGLEKPVQARAAIAEDGENTEDSGPNSSQEGFSFSNKRLCERWLDNLFMVLYEDLRIWTIFRAEVAHFKTQHVAYRKTGLEWEILGDLGQRLHHKEEAKEAFQRCLDSQRYSIKPWLKLMEMYADEGDLQRTLQTAIRVAAYQHNEYAELSYPTSIAHQLFKLGQIHGHAKISYTLMSMGLPDPILKIMESYLKYGQNFQVEGFDF